MPAQADDLGPRAPWVAERRIERERPRQEAVDLVEHEAFGLQRRRPPADLEPHQSESAGEQRLPVGRIGPPWGDVDGQPGVADRSFEPGVVARPERRRDRAVDGEAHAVGRADMERGAPAGPQGAGVDEGPAEPREVGPFGGRAVGEGQRCRFVDFVRVVRVDAAPVHREVLLQALEEPAHEAVVTGAERGGVGLGLDTASVGRRQHQRSGGRMERHLEPGFALGGRRQARRAHQVGVVRGQPGVGIGQQALGGRDARDQAAPRGLANDAGSERGDDHGYHRSLDDTAVDRPCRRALRTTRRTGRSTPSSHIRPLWSGLDERATLE